MQPETSLTAVSLRAPRAAAIAGIVFSVLLITSFVLLRRSVPADPLEAGAWLRTRASTVTLALTLVPFAGIAFLWFIGVLRDRLACLTRKTHAFAKEPTMWDAAVGLALFAHNWLRPHPALRLPLAEPVAGTRYLRRTPAMVLGLTDHPWSFVEFLTRPVPHYAWG